MKNQGELKTQVLLWDYKDQIDLKALNAALAEVVGDGAVPVLTEVSETGSDDYAVVVSSKKLSKKEAQEVYDEWLRY